MTTSPSAALPRPRVWWRALVLAIPLFVLGFSLGGYVVHNFDTRIQPGFNAMFDEHMVSQYAYLQYQQASYAEAKAALERYLRVLAGPQPQNPLSDVRMRRFESMLTWGRLALLHERNGRKDLAETAWQRSEALAKETSWRDPSRQRVRSLLERIDSAPKDLPPPANTGR